MTLLTSCAGVDETRVHWMWHSYLSLLILEFLLLLLRSLSIPEYFWTVVVHFSAEGFGPEPQVAPVVVGVTNRMGRVWGLGHSY